MVLQMFKAMHDIATLSAQKKKAIDNQAFELGMKFKRLEKYCARQKEIHEQIREANASILKDAELKQSMAAEANDRAKAAETRVTEMQKKHAEMQKQLTEVQEEVNRLIKESCAKPLFSNYSRRKILGNGILMLRLE